VRRFPPVVKINLKTALLAATLVVCSGGCTVGPRYKRPTAQVPDTWKGEGPWQTAAPKDAIPKGTWWQLFHDTELDQLEQQVLQANQSLEAARARLSQARAQARIASSAYFPTLTADPSGLRERFSGNRPLEGANPALVVPDTENVFTIPFSASYEVDLFGRVRKGLEAANASLQGSAADLENVRLVLTAISTYAKVTVKLGLSVSRSRLNKKGWIWSIAATKVELRMVWKWHSSPHCWSRLPRSFNWCCSSGRSMNMLSLC
jgi:hypothetical protein